MPWARPPLSQLLSDVASDIMSAIPGADALLRYANLTTLGRVFAGLAHLHYGYQDWIAKQAVPFTAEDEFLQGWAGLKNVILKPASIAGVAPASPGIVTFTNCTPGKEIAGEAPLVRGDGVNFVCIGGGVVDGGGTVAISVAAIDAGAAGNSDVGVVMTLGVSIAGIQSSGNVTTAIRGGADVESNDSLRGRMIAAYQSPPQGGNAGDYVRWSLEVAGVTRAWCRPSGAGAGTVIAYFMMDDVEAAHGGFPQGDNGVAALEPRAAAATGDQLIVANYLFPREPVPALVYASAPTNNPVPITIDGIAGASADTKTAISKALADAFFRKGSPGAVFLPDGTAGGTIDVSDLESAIASVPNTDGFVLTAPAGNIVSGAGALPTLGAITYT